MKCATTWIENNPNTGDIKSWEVWFQAKGSRAYRVASCKSKEAAEKSQAKMISRNEEFYSILAINA